MPTEEQLKKIQTSIAALTERFEKRASKLNILLMGESGSGKSFFARTCPKPVLIDSFDPGGSIGLRHEEGVTVDSTWEGEDPFEPKAFKQWERTLNERIRDGFFEYFNTYVLDSLTTWSDAIMNQILMEAKIPGKPPRFTHDYGPQKNIINNTLHKLLALPCNFILTAHLEVIKDELSGAPKLRLMTTGKGVVGIPLLFDELWVMDPVRTSTGVDYRLLTKSTGTYLARSRLSAGGILSPTETPDLNALLKKVEGARKGSK